MNQNNLDKQIRDAYENLEQSNFDQAASRKEKIWNELQPAPKNFMWLRVLSLLFLGIMLFALGCYFNKAEVEFQNNEIPLAATDDEKMKALEMSVFELQEALKMQQRRYDSLSVLNQGLAMQLSNLSLNNVPNVQNNVNTKVIVDTVYLKEVKVDKQWVERIIRDTVFIEVPVKNDFLEPALASIGDGFDEDEASENENPVDEKLSNERGKARSVQFNFSETRHKGK